MGGTGYFVSSASSVAGAYAQSQAIKAQGDYGKQVAQTNAELSDAAAADAIKRGEKDTNAAVRRSRIAVGAQRAAFGANGSDVNSGSAADVVNQTQTIGALDALTIKNNAQREAWGYKMQSSNYRAQGDMAEITAQGEANQTLLNGGLRAISSAAEGVAASRGGTRQKGPSGVYTNRRMPLEE